MCVRVSYLCKELIMSKRREQCWSAEDFRNLRGFLQALQNICFARLGQAYSSSSWVPLRWLFE